TPRHLIATVPRPIGGLLWGLDTGSVFSTFRASAASWATALLIMDGWAPWWIGGGYGVAFSVPLGLLILVGEARARLINALSPREGLETYELVDKLARSSRYLRLVSIAVMMIGGWFLVLGIK